MLFEHVLFIDDPLGASAVHLAAGAVGMLFVSFMANPEYAGEDFTGILYGGSFRFLLNQLWGMLVYSAWTLGTSGVVFYGLSALGMLRVSEEEELVGVDITHHGGPAYPIDDAHMTAPNSISDTNKDTDSEGKATSEPIATPVKEAAEEVTF